MGKSIRVKVNNVWNHFSLARVPVLQEFISKNYNLINESQTLYSNNLIPIIDLKGPAVEFYKKFIPSVHPYTYFKEHIFQSNSFKFFWTDEAVSVDPDKYDFSMGFDYIDHPRYFRFPIYHGYVNHKISLNYHKDQCNPNKSYFACFLVTNNYNEIVGMEGVPLRNKMFDNLSEYKFVASGGRHKNNLGKVIPHEETMDFLGKCKFVIAYENQQYEGYITEKVFRAYYAGSVPIYWGHPRNFEEINKNAVINVLDFKDNHDLIQYIKKVDQDDDLYCKIYKQPILTDERYSYKNIYAEFERKFTHLLDQYVNNFHNKTTQTPVVSNDRPASSKVKIDVESRVSGQKFTDVDSTKLILMKNNHPYKITCKFDDDHQISSYYQGAKMDVEALGKWCSDLANDSHSDL